MTTTVPVDGIQFDFDDSWVVTKWDDLRAYRDGLAKLQGVLDGHHERTRALDLVGVREGTPYLFEVKDFRGFEIENKSRQLEELPLEIALKVRDTIAGLVGTRSLGRASEALELWIAALAAGTAVRVIAWIAEDGTRPGISHQKRAARASERLGRLKQRLAWLTPRVAVTDPLENPLAPGVTASSLHGAGVARRP
ncbi:MAG: hypothetical protein KF773_40705 [Deltaproteobacteria bacterium]|nr:hypothetical protein [Deltaproteobacteria bacterium]